MDAPLAHCKLLAHMCLIISYLIMGRKKALLLHAFMQGLRTPNESFFLNIPNIFGSTKGGLKSESTGGFFHCPKWMPKIILLKLCNYISLVRDFALLRRLSTKS